MTSPTHKILCEVAEKYGVTLEDMKSAKRDYVLVDARMEFARRARHDRPWLTYGQIGFFICRTTWTVRYYLGTSVKEYKRAKMRKRHKGIGYYAECPDNWRNRIVWSGVHQEAVEYSNSQESSNTFEG